MRRFYTLEFLTIAFFLSSQWLLGSGLCPDHKDCKKCVHAFESSAMDYCLWCSKTNFCFDLAVNQTYCGGSSNVDTVSLAYESKCQSFLGMPLATGIIVLIVLIVLPICLGALGVYCFISMRRSKPSDYQAMSALDRRNKPNATPSRSGYTYQQHTPRSAGYTTRDANSTPRVSLPREPPASQSQSPAASLYAPLVHPVQGPSDSTLVSLEESEDASQVIGGYYLPPHLVPGATMTGTYSAPPPFTFPPPSVSQLQARSSFITQVDPPLPPPPFAPSFEPVIPTTSSYMLPKSNPAEGFLDLEEDLQSVDET